MIVSVMWRSFSKPCLLINNRFSCSTTSYNSLFKRCTLPMTLLYKSEPRLLFCCKFAWSGRFLATLEVEVDQTWENKHKGSNIFVVSFVCSYITLCNFFLYLLLKLLKYSLLQCEHLDCWPIHEHLGNIQGKKNQRKWRVIKTGQAEKRLI